MVILEGEGSPQVLGDNKLTAVLNRSLGCADRYEQQRVRAKGRNKVWWVLFAPTTSDFLFAPKVWPMFHPWDWYIYLLIYRKNQANAGKDTTHGWYGWWCITSQQPQKGAVIFWQMIATRPQLGHPVHGGLVRLVRGISIKMLELMNISNLLGWNMGVSKNRGTPKWMVYDL